MPLGSSHLGPPCQLPWSQSVDYCVSLVFHDTYLPTMFDVMRV